MRMALIIGGLVIVLAGFVGAWIFLIQPDKSDGVALQMPPKDSREDRVEGGSSRQEVGAGTVARATVPGSTGRGGAAPSGVDPDDRFEPGEVLVANPPDGFEGTSATLGFRVLETIILGELDLRILRMQVPAGMAVPDAVQLLRQRFPRVTIDANHVYEPSQRAGSSDSYAREMIGWNEVPATCGKGVSIGMIDSGVDLTHPAFAGVDIVYEAFNRPSREPGPPDHGTAIAVLMVGRPAEGKGWGGLLPGASLTAANMFEVNEQGKVVGNARGLLKAVDWMASRKVPVVNLSIAGPDNKVVRLAFDRARRKGIILVAAAGNWGSSTKPAYPAAYRHAIAVTAVNGRRSVYSHANRGRYVDFAAPGVRMWTAAPGGGGKFQSGTSFASPYVAVLTALSVAKGNDATPDGLRDLLRSSVVDLGAPGRDDVFGWGLIGMARDCLN